MRCLLRPVTGVNLFKCSYIYWSFWRAWIINQFLLLHFSLWCFKCCCLFEKIIFKKNLSIFEDIFHANKKQNCDPWPTKLPLHKMRVQKSESNISVVTWITFIHLRHTNQLNPKESRWIFFWICFPYVYNCNINTYSCSALTFLWIIPLLFWFQTISSIRINIAANIC